MVRNASGQDIWVASQTAFEYIVVEGTLVTELRFESLAEHLASQFATTYWPCGSASFLLEKEGESFFCVDKSLKIGLIIIPENRSVDAWKSYLQDFFGKVIQDMEHIIAAIHRIDKNATLNNVKISVQQTAKDAG